MNSTVKTVVFWLVIVLSGVLLWQVVKAGGSGAKPDEPTFSQFLNNVDKGEVKEVTVSGTELTGKSTEGKAFHTIIPPNYPDMYKTLRTRA